MRKSLLIVSLALGLSALAVAQGGTILLNAAGATFPYPIYSKWFDVYHNAHPNVQINYQSIGSGGGIRQLLAGTVDFGASDGPMSDEQLRQAKFKILHFPTVLGAVVPTYNIAGVSGRTEFHAEGIGGNLSGDDHKVERSGNRQSELGSETSERRHRCDSPIGWQRDHLHLDGFSGKS